MCILCIYLPLYCILCVCLFEIVYVCRNSVHNVCLFMLNSIMCVYLCGFVHCVCLFEIVYVCMSNIDNVCFVYVWVLI
jgi:hypothetical protein